MKSYSFIDSTGPQKNACVQLASPGRYEVMCRIVRQADFELQEFEVTFAPQEGEINLGTHYICNDELEGFQKAICADVVGAICTGQSKH